MQKRRKIIYVKVEDSRQIRISVEVRKSVKENGNEIRRLRGMRVVF